MEKNEKIKENFKNTFKVNKLFLHFTYLTP